MSNSSLSEGRQEMRSINQHSEYRISVLPACGVVNAITLGRVSRRPPSRQAYAAAVIVIIFCNSPTETNAAQKVLKPRVRAQRVETRPQENRRVKSLFVRFS